MEHTVEEMEENLLEEEDFEQHPPPDIIAYNELRSCADLFRMHSKGILNIKPDFQRDFVWNSAEQTRFIDSLIKQLPIPSMCFSVDYKTQKWQVIDGLQRMSTIVKFLSDNSAWKLSSIEDVDSKISGKKVSEFHKEESSLHEFLTRVENLTLPITVIRCDYSKSSHLNYLFTIFHRLNSGGNKLTNQEIRNCIYSGSFNNTLKELSKLTEWGKILENVSGTQKRFASEELILRFYAYNDSINEYKGRLAKFLNDYMDKKRNINEEEISEKKEIFKKTVTLIEERILKDSKSRMKISILESLLYGVSSNLEKLLESETNYPEVLFKKLTNHPAFSDEKLKEGLSVKERVFERMETAKNIFAEV